MRKSLYLIFYQILCLELTHGWDNVFHFNKCYESKVDEKMPLSIDNFIAIIEGYEKENSNTAPEDIADALLYRYRKNGVIYSPKYIIGGPWFVGQQSEKDKQTLDDKLLKLSKIVPEDALQPREECSVHMTLSHSMDFYPHTGVDYIWDNNYFKRKKRSVVSSYTFRDLPENMDLAEHPIEFGVIQTSAGPVSGGLLLAGILSSAATSSYTVKELLDTDKVPSDVLSYKILPLYGTTISGILAKAAILTLRMEDDFEMGPIGMFGNCSSCPRLYSLEKNDVYHLTRAELFGALDGFIIGRYLQNQGISQSVTLSEILRMYYSDHGLYNPDIRACNRQNIFTKYRGDVSDTIKDQALYYMYVYQQYFTMVSTLIDTNYEDSPDAIQETFLKYLSDVLSATSSFMSSYSYDDPGYYRCPTISDDDNKYETQVDLAVVYSPSGSSSDVENQLEYIGLTARLVGVGYYRSRIAVLNGRNNEWISPMTNYTNIADYVCNYTTSVNYAVSSSQDFAKILDSLSKFYNDHVYSKMKSDPDLTGRNSQVVLWNLPNSFDGDPDVMLRDWNTFNQTYPDVSFMFVGSKGASILSFLGDQVDDVTIIQTSSSTNPIEISTDIVTNIKKAPRMFYYAACDTKNSEYSNYNEDDHIYTTYVSPNFSTIIKIPPQNFHFSETLKLKMQGSDLRICLSRTNSQPSENVNSDQTYCADSPFDYERQYLCDRYLDQCHPIYISVTANSRSTNSYCSDDYCVYPNQIEFKMTHEGMVCSSCLLSPTLLLLFFITTVVIILGN